MNFELTHSVNEMKLNQIRYHIKIKYLASLINLQPQKKTERRDNFTQIFKKINVPNIFLLSSHSLNNNFHYKF